MGVGNTNITPIVCYLSGRCWDGLMVRTLCCGHSDPGSIPGLNKIVFVIFHCVTGLVAKWGSRWAHNPKVRGSKPRHASFLKTIKHSFTLYHVYLQHLRLQMGRLLSPSDPAPFCLLYNHPLSNLTNYKRIGASKLPYSKNKTLVTCRTFAARGAKRPLFVFIQSPKLLIIP